MWGSVNKLAVQFPRTNYMKNGSSYSGSTHWNSLPCNIRESGSIIIFRHGIHGNQVFKWHIGVSSYNVRIMTFSS